MSVRDIILRRARMRAVARTADRSYEPRAEIGESDTVPAEPALQSLPGVSNAPAEMAVAEGTSSPSITKSEEPAAQIEGATPLPGLYESRRSNRLSESEKLFVVQQLAMYRTPSETADLVKEKYGKNVSRQAVNKYSPESGRVSAKWRDIFHTTRNKYLQQIADIPIANPVYRLRLLQGWLDCENRKLFPDRRLVCEILALAAKEAGGRLRAEKALRSSDT